MDEASNVVAVLATRFRFLEGARVLRVEPLHGHLGILVDQLNNVGVVQYTFALVVVGFVSDTSFIVTAEVNELSNGPTNSHFLGSFDDFGHANHGIASLGDVEVFASRALTLARARIDAR